MTHVLIVIGTRPELIKTYPVIRALRARPETFSVRVLFSGQHRSLLDQIAEFFDLQPDIDLRVMRHNQGLSKLTARLLKGLDEVIEREHPDVVLAQGDTSTAFSAALAAYHRQIPFGHIEAGLRSFDLGNPFPEEGNRRMISAIATHHFAPTNTARQNLLFESVNLRNIEVTGNTGIDTLLQTSRRRDLERPKGLRANQRTILLTVHRRENFGQPIHEIFRAARTIAESRPDTLILYPVHPNPNVGELAHELLDDLDNVVLTPPLEYGRFVATMKHATIVLSDSGGIQEEAPSLGVPVLVLRETTERPEGIEAGVARLVGTNHDNIVENALTLLDCPKEAAAMRTSSNPYGDGLASERIADILEEHYTAPAEVQSSEVQSSEVQSWATV